MGLTANELSLEIGTGGSNPLASAVSRVMTVGNYAPVAQRIEHLTTDQKVRGSNPFGRTFGKSPASIRMREIFVCGVVAGGLKRKVMGDCPHPVLEQWGISLKRRTYVCATGSAAP